MKTSNKLLITAILLGIAITLTMFLVTIHKLGNSVNIEYILKSSPLPSFSVVVAMGHTEFNVEGSDTNQLKWRVPKKDSAKLHGVKMFVRNDTLFVEQTSSQQLFNDRVVVCCKSLRSVSVTNKDLVEVRRLNTMALEIRNTNSQVYVNNWEGKPLKELNLTILASDTANIDLFNVTVSRLNATLDTRSTMLSHEQVRIAEAQIKRSNHSNFTFDLMPLKLLVQSDSTTMW